LLHAIEYDRNLEWPEKVKVKEHEEDCINSKKNGVYLVELFCVPNAHKLKKLIENRCCDCG